MDQTNITKPSSLSSIGQLFSESWDTFTKSILQFILLNILGIVIYVVLAILAFVILVLTGVGTSLLQKGFSGFATITPATIITLVVVGSLSALIFLIVGAAIQITSILIVDDKAQASLGTKFKKSFGFILPLFIINLLVGLLTLGGFFLFIIPGILISILFSFVQFEVILNNQTGISSLKRSVAIISHNFGAIFIRFLLLFLIATGVTIVVSIFNNIMPPDSKWLIGILSFLFNMGWGWFTLSFSVNLYKQVRFTLDNNQVGNIVWIWIVALLGWLIALAIIFASYKVISSGVLNEAFYKNKAESELNSL